MCANEQVLITGGPGFSGSDLAHRLPAEGARFAANPTTRLSMESTSFARSMSLASTNWLASGFRCVMGTMWMTA
jgi:hypothetical protein